MRSFKNKHPAFTIVELLIVIVIIGILASITIVSFSGITNQANIATVQSDLNSNGRKLQLYFTQYGSYPTALDGSNCPSAPTVDSNYCLKLTSGNTLYSYTGNSSTYTLRLTKGSLAYQITPDTGPSVFSTLLTAPTISSIYSTYDLLFCRYTTDCSGISGISADFSYQVAFTAKASSKYAINMVQIDSTSTSWITGTLITTNIAYSTPTTGASLSSNVITTTNAGETRVTFTGTGLTDKTLVARITEVDSSNNAISVSAHTKALGVYTTVGSYTLTSPAANTVNYLVVAGGGSGGHTGGGGAGGYLAGSLSINSGSNQLSVGAGGALKTSAQGGQGITGSNTIFNSITANGGGGGGMHCGPNPSSLPGGSGGGGGEWSETCNGPWNEQSGWGSGAAGIAGQGFAGGSGYYCWSLAITGGGGGGAGGIGANSSGGCYGGAGNGGIGKQSTISGSPTMYAGGGGGGLHYGSGPGTGGSGGGGTGGVASSTAGVSGLNGKGGGGGGGSAYLSSGAGGSGIVIFRTT